MNDHIRRPVPMDEPVTALEQAAHALGFTVYPDDTYAMSGMLAPGTYRRSDAVYFLTAIRDLGSNQAVDAWIDEHPLVETPAVTA